MNTPLSLLALLFFTYPLHADEGLKKKGATSNVFINGGHTEATDYQIHHDILKAFYFGLFKTDAEVLNAGGPGTLMLPSNSNGTFRRDASGRVVLVPSEMPFDTLPATESNVMRVFNQLVENKPLKATIVYGDHGGPAGVSLWANADLSATKIRDFQNRLDPNTVLRSIHIHCESGNAILDPKRGRPQNWKDWDGYLNKYFRPNSCALGLGWEDESVQSYGWGTDWENNPWYKIFKEKPKLSLTQLKEILVADGNIAWSQVLTSDYLVSDLTQFVCESSGSGFAVETKEHSTHLDEKHAHPAVSVRELLCSTEGGDKKMKTATEQFQKASSAAEEISRLKNRLIKMFLEKEKPGLSKKNSDATEAIEMAEAEYLLKAKSYPKELATVFMVERDQKIQSLRSKDVVDYEMLRFNIKNGNQHTKEFKSYLESAEVKKFLLLEKTKEKYPAYYSLKEKLGPKTDFDEVRRTANREEDLAQKKRREIANDVLIRRKKAVEKILSLPDLDERFEPIKRVYEKIKECENSILG